MGDDALGDRMKAHESRETGRRLLPMVPVCARVDGRAFHSFTRGMGRPFDPRMTAAMVGTARRLAGATHARIAYVQSDEVSLVWLAERSDAGIFLDGRIAKMTSVLAALATAALTREVLDAGGEFAAYADRLPHFDARVWQVPNREEAADVFLWRNLDATRNALGMAASAHYPARELHGRNGADKREMLFAKGVNFDDYPEAFKRGTFVRRAVVERPLAADELARIPERYRPAADALVTRSEIRVVPMPPFARVTNRAAVIFDGAEPVTADPAGDPR